MDIRMCSRRYTTDIFVTIAVRLMARSVMICREIGDFGQVSRYEVTRNPEDVETWSYKK